jgi:hypothetical protein
MLGEDFEVREQNRGVIKEIKTNPERISDSVGHKIRDEVPHPRDPFPL